MSSEKVAGSSKSGTKAALSAEDKAQKNEADADRQFSPASSTSGASSHGSSRFSGETCNGSSTGSPGDCQCVLRLSCSAYGKHYRLKKRCKNGSICVFLGFKKGDVVRREPY